MYDLISLGHITLDLFFKGKSLTQGKDRFQLAIGGKYAADEFHTSVGGSGANVAVGASKLGLKAAVCGKIGENVFRQIIMQRLLSANVSTQLLIHSPQYTNISTILLTQKGEKTVIHYVRPTARFINHKSILNKLSATRFLYLGNLWDVAIAERLQIVKKIQAAGVRLILNLGITDCRRGLSQVGGLIKRAHIFILNTHEFAELIGIKHKKLKLQDDCRQLLRPHTPGVLILTDAHNGSYIYSDTKVKHILATKVRNVVDTTGAGDAYVSGLVAAYCKEGSIEKAARAGSDYCATVIGKLGAQ